MASDTPLSWDFFRTPDPPRPRTNPADKDVLYHRKPALLSDYEDFLIPPLNVGKSGLLNRMGDKAVELAKLLDR